MPAIILPKGTALLIQGKDKLATPEGTSLVWNRVTEHNRDPISVNSMRIETAQRMANGSLRKFFVADKKSFAISWNLVPSYRTETVDGYWGAEDLREFYKSVEGQGIFKIRFNFAKNGVSQESLGYEEYDVSFSECSFTLNRRGVQAFWDISMSMEEA